MTNKAADPETLDPRDFPHWIAASVQLFKRRPLSFSLATLVFLAMSMALHRHIELFSFALGIFLQTLYLWLIILLAWCSDYSTRLFSIRHIRITIGLITPCLAISLISLLTIVTFSLITRLLLSDAVVQQAADVSQLLKPHNWWEFSILMTQLQLFVFLTCCLLFQQIFLIPLKGIAGFDVISAVKLSSTAHRKNIDLSIGLVLVMLTAFLLIWLMQAYAAAASLVLQPACGLLLYVLFRQIFMHRKNNLPEAVPRTASVAVTG